MRKVVLLSSEDSGVGVWYSLPRRQRRPARLLLRAQCLGMQAAGKELLVVTCSSCSAGACVRV